MLGEEQSWGRIVRLLVEIQRRRTLRLGIAVVLWAVAAVALGLSLHRVLLGLNVLDQSGGMLFAGLCGLAALLLGGAIAVFRAPDLQRVARQTDTEVHLSERLSTALEVSGKGNTRADPVVAALMADASAQAGRVQPERLFALFSLWSAGATGAIAVAGILWLAVPMAGAEPRAVAPSSTEPEVASTAPAGATVEDIKLMAELVEQAARLRDEDTLRNVGDRLNMLAADAGRTFTQEELAREFAQLVEEAVVGFGDVVPDWLPRDGDISDIGRKMTAFREARALQLKENQDYADQNLEIIKRVLAEQARETESLAQLSADASGNDDMGEGTLGQGATSASDAMAFGDAMPALDSDATSDQPLDPMGLMPAGAAQQSGKGESDMAGAGSQELAEDDGFTEIPLPQGNEMILTAAEFQPGNRITIQVAPEAGSGELSGDAAATLTASLGSSELVLMREQIGLAEGRIVGRYFSPWGILPDETATP